MNEKLAELRKMVKDANVIRMVYLNENGELCRVGLTIDGDEPTEDELILLREKAERASFRVFEVLSIIGGRFVTSNGDWFSEPVADNMLSGALALAEENREYYLSTKEMVAAE